MVCRAGAVARPEDVCGPKGRFKKIFGAKYFWGNPNYWFLWGRGVGGTYICPTHTYIPPADTYIHIPSPSIQPHYIAPLPPGGCPSGTDLTLYLGLVHTCHYTTACLKIVLFQKEYFKNVLKKQNNKKFKKTKKNKKTGNTPPHSRYLVA